MKKLILHTLAVALIQSVVFSSTARGADAAIVTTEQQAQDAQAAAAAAKAKADAASAEAAKAQKDADAAAAALAKAKGKTAESAKAAVDNTVAEQLKGFGFGAGIGAVFDVGGSKRIKNATVDANGIVRVQEESPVRLGAILETHYLWKYDSGNISAESRRIMFHGPQISAVLGDNVIEGLGVGYMVALRRRNIETANFGLKSFNLGVGAMIQPAVQTLGDGLNANQPLPAGDQLRYHTGPKAGVYAVFSVGF